MGLGVGFTPFETRIDVIARVTRHAEEIGLDRVDVAEGWTHDSTIVLAELAAQTSRIGLGTGIVAVWSRTPATIALGATGLQRLSEGRFSLGIGADSPSLAETFSSWLAAGADSINLVLPPGHPEEELMEFLDVAAGRYVRS